MKSTRSSSPIERRLESILTDLRQLGVKPGDTVMVHASLKAVGPVEGGAAGLVQALRSSVGPSGNLLAYVSWDRSPYEETLNGALLSQDSRDAWPAFDPATAGTYRGFGLLNSFLVAVEGARRSPHPDASMVAIGPDADYLVGQHPMGHAFGPGSPLERFLALRGRVLLLGSPLDAVTVLHYAEAIARIPNKRRVSYEMPLLSTDGTKVWESAEDWDSNGILDCFAEDGRPDAVETMARLYVEQQEPPSGFVGQARCYYIDAADLVQFGTSWLELNFGTPS